MTRLTNDLMEAKDRTGHDRIIRFQNPDPNRLEIGSELEINLIEARRRFLLYFDLRRRRRWYGQLPLSSLSTALHTNPRTTTKYQFTRLWIGKFKLLNWKPQFIVSCYFLYPTILVTLDNNTTYRATIRNAISSSAADIMLHGVQILISASTF